MVELVLYLIYAQEERTKNGTKRVIFHNKNLVLKNPYYNSMNHYSQMQRYVVYFTQRSVPLFAPHECSLVGCPPRGALFHEPYFWLCTYGGKICSRKTLQGNIIGLSRHATQISPGHSFTKRAIQLWLDFLLGLTKLLHGNTRQNFSSLVHNSTFLHKYFRANQKINIKFQQSYVGTTLAISSYIFFGIFSLCLVSIFVYNLI